MSKPVVWFEVLGKDEAALQRFYGELFGWKIDAGNPMRYGLVEKTGDGIPGGIGKRDAAFEHRVTFYVGSDDLAGDLERAKRLGGKVVMPVTKPELGPTMAFFADPEGNVIGLVAE